MAGTSEVNQASITGESVPVPKELGSQVFAGTINGDGALEVRSTKPASDTTLAHIIQMVGEAQAKKAPSEQWVERFARYYTPIVFASAILVFLSWGYLYALESTRTYWMSHYYLVLLVSFLMIWMPAARRYSIDARRAAVRFHAPPRLLEDVTPPDPIH